MGSSSLQDSVWGAQPLGMGWVGGLQRLLFLPGLGLGAPRLCGPVSPPARSTTLPGSPPLPATAGPPSSQRLQDVPQGSAQSRAKCWELPPRACCLLLSGTGRASCVPMESSLSLCVPADADACPGVALGNRELFPAPPPLPSAHLL